MKRISSVLLITALLFTMLTPITFAAVSAVSVAESGETIIELDDYYKEYDTGVTVSNANASGSSLVRVQDKTKFSGPSDPATADRKTTPVVRTITLNVKASGIYDIEWVANETNNSDSSAMTLAVNDTDVFKVIAEYSTTIKDGRGNIAKMTDTSASTDAGYSVDVVNGASTLQYVMKKYNSTVTLVEGTNTITLYTLGGLQWGTYNFVMDYVKLIPVAAPETEEVSMSKDTVIELEKYFTGAIATDSNASGGYLVKANDKSAFSGADDPTGSDRLTTPLVRTITLDVEAAGNYSIEWVANANYDGDSSAMTLAVNDTDVFKVISDNGTIRKDGRGNDAQVTDVSPSTDAGYTVTIAYGGVDKPYVMKKYNSTVALNEGVNTIELYTIGGLNSKNYNFVMDYVKFSLEELIVSSGRETRIELENYYKGAVVTNEDASGGAYVIASDKGAFAETGDPVENRRTTPLVRTITLDVETAGEYSIEWVANKFYNADTSPMTLAVNGTDIFKVVSTGNDFSITGTPVVTRDGKGQDATGVISTTCVDAYPDVAIPDKNYDLQSFSKIVNLNQGINTVELYVVGGVQWGNYNFAMDYVAFRPTGEDIYAAWGDFEFEQSRYRVVRKNNNISWATGGAQSSGHCLELSNLEYQTGDLYIDLYGVGGESYDVSFYMKSKDSLSNINIDVILGHSEGGWTYVDSYKVGWSWAPISFTVDCGGKNDQGATVTGVDYIIVRFNDAPSYAKVCLDKLQAYPHGKVEADYSRLNTNLYGITQDPQAPARAIESQTSELDIYVDAQIGNDNAAGTQSAPLKTIEAARDMAAQYAPTMQDNIRILIRGEQYLENTFELNENHSGQNGYSIVYTSWGDEKATLTMAKEYSGFQLHDAEKNIWKTYVGQGTYSRQAYFNDVKGIRSRNIGYLENAERVGNEYFLCDNTELLDFKYPNEIDMVFHVLWVSDRVLINTITEENGRVKIVPHSRMGYCDITNTYASTGARSTPSYIENAYELLDEKGEWYLNKHDGYMYYIPRAGEDMKTMVCKIPIGEEMIYGSGSDYDKPVSNIIFDNIIFEGTTWLYPDRTGAFATRQANYLQQILEIPESYAAIHFEKCQNIKMTNNIFRQLGFTGVDFVNGSRNIDIIGNEFYDISNTAMLIDDYRTGIRFYMDFFGGSPYRRPQETWCDYINITNNYIHDIAGDYNGAAGVTIGFPRHTKFSHNEISNTPYSGMHVGWGWGVYGDSGTIMYDLEISYNYIHDVMNGRVNDGAAIYTLGAGSLECDKTNTAKNNRIIGNYLTNGWSCDYVYPDEGSTCWYIANNVSDNTRVKEWEYNFDREILPKEDHYWLHMHAPTIKWITTENNYSDVDYSSTMMNQQESNIGNTILVTDGNWPDAAKAIMNNAGIEPAYRANFNLDTAKVLVCDNKWSTLTLNTPTESGLMILGGDNSQKYSLADYNTELWVEDDAVTLDPETGKLTAHKVGTYEAEAVATINGVTHVFHMMFDCEFGDKVDDVTIDAQTSTAYATVFYNEAYTGTAMIAVYDEHNRLIGLNSAAIGEDYAALSAKYDGTAASVKVYVWDNLANCKPLATIKAPSIN